MLDGVAITHEALTFPERQFVASNAHSGRVNSNTQKYGHVPDCVPPFPGRVVVSPAMDHQQFLDVIEREAAALVAAARTAGPTAAVPATPEWTMAKLVKHTGTTHRWVLGIATTRAFVSPADLDLALPAGDDDYADWFAAGAADLVETLRGIDADADMWSWGPDQHARFWSRRMAHETTVHRWDAESAAGGSGPIETALAIDGIDERLVNLTASLNFRPDDLAALVGDGESVHLHVTDGDGEWVLRFEPDGLAITREHAKGDVAVRGSAQDLLLYATGRRGLEGLEVFGDASVLESRDAIRKF